jgi:hypothetical protein
LILRSIGVETTPKRWCREVDNFKWTILRVVWSMDKDGSF